MRKLIPEVIPIPNLIKAIQSGRAKFFYGKGNKDLGEEIPFEVSWDPK